MTNPWQQYSNEILLCNFGGPEQAKDVEPFLTKLFEDPFIIRAPLGRLRPIIARRIAKRRAPDSIKEYEHIGFSPINKETAKQRDLLEAMLRELNPNTNVHVINRYTAPFASEVVRHLNYENSRIFAISLYPHLCHSTTVSSFRDLDQAITAHRGSNQTLTYKSYTWWANSKFINLSVNLLQNSLKELIQNQPEGNIQILFSSHGLPMRYHQRGDPYFNEILGHFTEVSQRVKFWLESHDSGRHQGRCHFRLSFQSRVGRMQWLKPYTEQEIARLGQTKGHLLVVPISFVSDHIETLYEMDVTYRDLAMSSGFATYSRQPAPGACHEMTEVLVDALKQVGFQ